MRRLRWHFRCIAAVASSYILGTQTALSVVGFVCRRILGLPIASVFLLYPARKEYADALAYRWHQRRFGWQPGLVGFYRQGRRYGLIFGIPNLEDEIRAPENAARVLAVMSRMEAIQRRVGAPRKVFAGILPSTLARNGAEDQHLAQQRHLTARAVLQALDHVMDLSGLTRDVRILVLGGRGYIASEVIRLGSGLRITSIDADRVGRVPPVRRRVPRISRRGSEPDQVRRFARICARALARRDRVERGVSGAIAERDRGIGAPGIEMLPHRRSCRQRMAAVSARVPRGNTVLRVAADFPERPHTRHRRASRRRRQAGCESNVI